MITIKKEMIHHIPALHIANAEKFEQPLPTVIYFHGFNGEKESSLSLAYRVAERGVRVILPDCLMHGERTGGATLEEMNKSFVQIVMQTIAEIPEIKQYLEANQLIKDDRIGIGGTSMGGMISYAAVTKYEWIKAIAILMGTPYITKRVEGRAYEMLKEDDSLTEEDAEAFIAQIAAIDLSKQVEKLNERPLFIWHGEKDDILPVTEAQSFYNEVKKIYSDQQKVQFIEEADRVHNVSKYSMVKTADWFEKWL